MYKYRVDDGTTNKVINLVNSGNDKNKIDELLKELEGYNNMFDYSTDVEYEPVNLTRKEDVVIDNDAIKKQAEDDLQEYKTSSIENIKLDVYENMNKLNEDKKTSKANYETAVSNAKSYYDNAKLEASNDALKRGLSRSSVVINVMDAFSKEEISKYNKLNESLNNTLNAIDSEMSNLKLKQDKALQDFDIEYAVKLQDKINSLTDDMLQKQEEVISYNNEIALKEAEYNRKYAELQKELDEVKWDKEMDMMEYAGEYGVNMLNKYKQTKTYDLATQYLDTMDKSTAIYELTNNTALIELLGEENIAKLLEKYSS